MNLFKQHDLDVQRAKDIQKLTNHPIEWWDTWAIDEEEVHYQLEKSKDWFHPEIINGKFNYLMFESFLKFKPKIEELFPQYFNSEKYSLIIKTNVSEHDSEVIEVRMEWEIPDCPLIDSEDPLVKKVRQEWIDSVDSNSEHSFNDREFEDVEEIIRQLQPEFRDLTRWGVVLHSEHYDGSWSYWEHRLSEEIARECCLI